MITIRLPRDLAQDLRAPETLVAPWQETLGSLLRALDGAYPGILARLTEASGSLRPHINVFAGDRTARTEGGCAMPLADGEVVWILRAVSGG